MSIMYLLRQLGVLAWIGGYLPLLRAPLFLVGYIGIPISALILIYIFGGSAMLPLGYLGGLIMIILTAAVYTLSDAAYYRIELRFQDTIVASSVSVYTYAIGLALAELVYAVPAIVVFIVLIASTGILTAYSAIILLLALTPIWLDISLIGFTLSTYVSDVRYSWPISMLFSILLSFLAPVFYLSTAFPSDFRWPIYLSPTTFSSLLVQDATGLITLPLYEKALYWLVLALFTALSIILLWKKSMWRRN